MGGYENIAIRDQYGNIIGYQNTKTGMTSADNPQGIINYEKPITQDASPTFSNIITQYQMQHYASVGSGGTAYNPNAIYIPPNFQFGNNAAGIAAEVYFRGGQGAVDIGVAREAIAPTVAGNPSISPFLVNVAGMTAAGQRENVNLGQILTGNVPKSVVDIESGVQTGKSWLPVGIMGTQGTPIQTFGEKYAAYEQKMAEQKFMETMPMPFRSTPAVLPSGEVAAPVGAAKSPFGEVWGNLMSPFTGAGKAQAVGVLGAQPTSEGKPYTNATPVTPTGFFESARVFEGPRLTGSGYVASIAAVSTVGKPSGGADIGSPMMGETIKPPTSAPTKIPDYLTGSIIVPEGRYGGKVIEGVKTAVDPLTGEIAIYKQAREGSSVYNLLGGGGRYAAQSDRFQFRPEGAEKWTNLASVTVPGSENFSRAIAPGANIPWEVTAKTPALSSMGKEGIGAEIVLPGTIATASGRLVGTGFVAATTTTIDVDTGVPSGLPAPFVSPSSKPSDVSAPQASPLATFVIKSPQIITGAVAAGIDNITGFVGWTPMKDLGGTTDPRIQEYFSGRESAISAMKTMQSEGEAKYGVDTQGRIVVPETPEGLAFKTKYETVISKVEGIESTAKETGILKYEYGRGEYVINPELSTPYGEFSRWSRGAGSAIRGTLGFSQEQLEAYQTKVESKPGLGGVAERLIYGTGYTLSTDPGQFVSGAIGGAGLVLGAEVLGTSALATRIAGTLGQYPKAEAAVKILKDVGVPAAMIGLTYYSASEGLTATPERTQVNIGKTLPMLAGFYYGGVAVSPGTLAAVDSVVPTPMQRPVTQFGRPIEADVMVRASPELVARKTEYVKGYEPAVITITEADIKTPFPYRSAGSIDKPLQLPQDIAAPRSGKISLTTTPEEFVRSISPPQPETASASTLSSVLSWRERAHPVQTVAEIRKGMVGEAPYYPEGFFGSKEIKEPPVISEALGRKLSGIAEEIRVSKMEEWQSVAEIDYNRLQKAGIDIDISGQPLSPQTRVMREKQMSESIFRLAAEERPKTGELPYDLLPGVGKPEFGVLGRGAMPEPFAGLAEQMGLRIEPITPKAQPRGLETRYGEGTGISQELLMQIVNPEISTGLRTTRVRNIDVAITRTKAADIAAPVMKEARVREILPTLTPEAIRPKTSITTADFERALTLAVETEKRGVVIQRTPSPVVTTPVVTTMYPEPLLQPSRPTSMVEPSARSGVSTRAIATMQIPEVITTPAAATTISRTTRQIPAKAASEISIPVSTEVVLPSTGTTRVSKPDVVQRVSLGSEQISLPAERTARDTDRALLLGSIASPLLAIRTESARDIYTVPLGRYLYPSSPRTTDEPYRDIVARPNVPPMEPPTGGERGWKIPPPPMPLLWPGGIPGQGGSGSERRRKRQFFEYFPVGLDISTFGLSQQNPFVAGVASGRFRMRESGFSPSPEYANVQKEAMKLRMRSLKMR